MDHSWLSIPDSSGKMFCDSEQYVRGSTPSFREFNVYVFIITIHYFFVKN